MNVNERPPAYAPPMPSAPPQPVTRLTQELYDDISEYTRTADALAKSILSPVTTQATQGPQYAAPSGHTTVIHHNHYHDNSWWWARPYPSQTQNVYVSCDNTTRPSFAPKSKEEPKESKEKKEAKEKNDNTAAYLLLGAVTVIGLLWSAACAGSTFGSFNRQKEDVEETVKFKAKLLGFQQANPNLDVKSQSVLNAALKTADVREQLAREIANSSADDWANQLVVGGSCGLGLTASFMHLGGWTSWAPVAGTVAVIGGVAGVAKMIFKSYAESAHNKKEDLARKLQAKISDFNQILTKISYSVFS